MHNWDLCLLIGHDIQQVHGNGLNGGWSGSDGAGKRLRADGSINVRTDNVEAGGASYEGISPDSVCAGHDAVNGMASPARRAPSGMSEWGTTNDGTAINSRDQLLSHQRATSSHPSGAGSPHAQQVKVRPFTTQQQGKFVVSL